MDGAKDTTLGSADLCKLQLSSQALPSCCAFCEDAGLGAIPLGTFPLDPIGSEATIPPEPSLLRPAHSPATPSSSVFDFS